MAIRIFVNFFVEALHLVLLLLRTFPETDQIHCHIVFLEFFTKYFEILQVLLDLGTDKADDPLFLRLISPML